MNRPEPEAAAAASAASNRLVRVLCVDDNASVADAIRIKLSQEGGFDWKGSLASADAVLAAVKTAKPDILILDIDMPGRSPFEAMAEIQQVCPETRTVIFSGHVRSELIDRALECGAWGYVSKNDGENALIQALRDVARDELAMSEEVRATYERRQQ